MLSALAISSLLWLYLLPLFSFSTNSHPTQTPRMCWNKSDRWASWMKISSVFLPPSVVLTHDCLFQGTALPSVHGNANVTLLPLTWCPQLLIPSIHPPATPASWLFFYCIPFFSSLCLSRFYKMLSSPPFKVLLTPLLWLSIASSLFNPLCSPMFETILSKKKLILLLSPTYNF